MQQIWLSIGWAIFLVSVCIVPIAAQTKDPSPENSLSQSLEAKNSVTKFSFSLAPADASFGQDVTLSIAVNVAKGWHIGATAIEPESAGFPTQIKFLPVGLEALDAEFEPSVEPSQLKLASGTQKFMEGEFLWTRKYRVATTDTKYSGSGTIRFQACNDSKCLPPQTVEFALGQTRQTVSPSRLKKPMQPEDRVSIDVPEKTIGEPIVLPLEPSELTRTRPQIGNLFSLIFLGRATEKMIWKGNVQIGPNQVVRIYLPKASEYSLKNTGSDGTIVSNTATYVSVDQNGDGVLDSWEAAAADRPIRIHDSMYRITEINHKDRTLTLQQLDVPLKGSLIGFRCPDFELTALDGSVVSNKSILGKTTVLDIWAVTCHNCYEGFPKIQNALNKHSSEKLSVVLLTVDTDRQLYDKLAPKLFETYGGATWPQVMIPGGFDGALALGDYGFGSIVVDETGIVRAVGAVGLNIESTIDEVIKNAPSRSTR